MNHTTNPLHTLEYAAIGGPIERVGISLIPVYLHGGTTPDAPLHIATGIDSGIRIEEQHSANVPFLEATNPGDTPALLVSGQIVKGGLQTRILNVSVLIAGGNTITIPVSCVEQGRWNGGREFRMGEAFGSRRVRREKDASVATNVRLRGERYSDQGSVWRSVDSELSRMRLHHTTHSLEGLEMALRADIPTHNDPWEVRMGRIAEATTELQNLGPLPGQCGVIVCHGRRVVSAEVFATPDMLAAHWNALVASIMLDAPEVPPTTRPSLTKALRFLRRLTVTGVTVQPGVALGTEVHVRTPKLVAQALVLDRMVLHASAFAIAA